MVSPNRPKLSVTIPTPDEDFQRPVRDPSKPSPAPTLPKDSFIIEDAMEDIPLEKMTPPPPYMNSSRSAPRAQPHTIDSNARNQDMHARSGRVDIEKGLALARPWSAWKKAVWATGVLVGVVGVIGFSIYEAKRSGTNIK